MSSKQVILIPGMLNDAELWCDQVAALSEIACVHVADISQGATISEIAASVVSHVKGEFALVGFSLGGTIAFEILRQVPNRVTHLALLDTTALPDSPVRSSERERLLEIARSAQRFHGFGGSLINKYFAPKNRGDLAMVGRVRSMTRRLGAETFARQCALIRPDNRGSLADIKCPTLILCGEYDAITPPELHRDLADAIPNARFAILPDSGHLTPIEAPKHVTDALKTLLDLSGDQKKLSTSERTGR